MASLRQLLIRLGLKKPKAPPPPNPYISIGRYAYLQPSAKIMFAAENGPVLIGQFCSIAETARLSISNGAIVGAGAVVSKDVPPYAVVVGNPAQVVRYRFAPDIVSALQQIRWRDWPQEKIESEMSPLEDSVEAFVARHAVPR